MAPAPDDAQRPPERSFWALGLDGEAAEVEVVLAAAWLRRRNDLAPGSSPAVPQRVLEAIETADARLDVGSPSGPRRELRLTLRTGRETRRPPAATGDGPAE